MIELDHRAEQFLESIRQEGEESCAAIRRETEEKIEAELAATRAAEQARAETVLAFEKKRAAAAANRSMSETRARVRAELSADREQLTGQVFDDAAAELTAFTKTAGYAAWLAKSAARLAAAVGQGAVLYARGCDLPLLEKSLPAGCTLQADDAIGIGGLYAKGSELAADDTLAARLAAQKDWFLENSGLTVSV